MLKMDQQINEITETIQKVEIKSKAAYIPPHMRGKQQEATKPERFSERPSSFSDLRKAPREYSKSTDSFKSRNVRLEQELFGNQHNSGINFEKYDDIPVDVSGHDVPSPIVNFIESDLDALAKQNIELAGYTNATPVQKHSIAIVTASRDLMACAQTGSGKVFLSFYSIFYIKFFLSFLLDCCIFAADSFAKF